MRAESTFREAPGRIVLSGVLALLVPAIGVCAEAAETKILPLFKPEPAGLTKSFQVTIKEGAGLSRRAEPVTVSLPFAIGELKEPAVLIKDAAGRKAEAQFEVLARWPDQSIRWLLARFFVNARASRETRLTVQRGAGSSAARARSLATEADKKITVDTGALRAEVGTSTVDSFLVSDKAGKSWGRPGQCRARG